MYKIDLGNGNILECEKVGGSYVSKCSEGVFEGVKRVTITDGEGFEKSYKRGKIEGLSKVEDKWKFIVRELSEDERKEEYRSKKLKSQNEWIKEKYDRVSVTLPKGTKERIAEAGYTVNSFVNEAVKTMLETL